MQKTDETKRKATKKDKNAVDNENHGQLASQPDHAAAATHTDEANQPKVAPKARAKAAAKAKTKATALDPWNALIDPNCAAPS